MLVMGVSESLIQEKSSTQAAYKVYWLSEKNLNRLSLVLHKNFGVGLYHTPFNRTRVRENICSIFGARVLDKNTISVFIKF